MLGWIGKQIGDPGWKLRCVDPPIAWLQLRGGERMHIAVRIQLTCFMISKRAEPVLVRETQLVLTTASGQRILPWTAVSDVGGGPFPEPVGHRVTGVAAEHALIEYATSERDVVELLRAPGEPVPVVVEAMVNQSDHYRKVAEFDLIHNKALSIDADWRQIGTGR